MTNNALTALLVLPSRVAAALLQMSGRGRGEYYRNKYGGGGGGGRGRGGRRGGGGYHGGRGGGRGGQQQQQPRSGTYDDLQRLLQNIDGKQYGAYHDIETPVDSGWRHPDGFTLLIGRAQSDAFAPPTRCRLVVPRSVSELPEALFRNGIRRCAAADYLWRRLHETLLQLGADRSLAGGSGSGWSGPKGGDVRAMTPTQHVMEQSAVQIVDGTIYAHVTINLPARGRTILGQAAHDIFVRVLREVVDRSLKMSSLDMMEMTQHVESIEDQDWLQRQLHGAGLVAFLRNGAILPRASGVDDRPLSSGTVVQFASPPSLEVAFVLPNAGIEIRGMGIPRGITLLCGGGFHGKSTLLLAMQFGVYLKVPGDGREFCVTSPRAVKIRAEDGRFVSNVDISPFINNLPFDKDTKRFSTADASGSTSQASNIVESVELGADTLLVDEDTCATNFMIRDAKMTQLVASEKEPITPFVRVAPSLFSERNVSTVLVIGGAGDYFDIADRVLLMDCYRCSDATEKAKQIAMASERIPQPLPFGVTRQRTPVTSMLASDGKVKVQTKGMISYGDIALDLGAVEQIISVSQTSTIVAALQTLSTQKQQQGLTLRQTLEGFDQHIAAQGLDALAPGQFHGSLTKPRLFEIGAAVNRLRREQAVKQVG